MEDISIGSLIAPLFQYLISPALIVGFLLFFCIRIFKLGELSIKFKTLLKDVEGLKTDSNKVTKDVGVIRTHLISSLGMKAELFTSSSPITLQPKGEEILEKSGFKKIYEDDKEPFVSKIKQLNVKNPDTKK